MFTLTHFLDVTLCFRYQVCASNTCTTNGKREITQLCDELPTFIVDQIQEVLGPTPKDDECLFLDADD